MGVLHDQFSLGETSIARQELRQADIGLRRILQRDSGAVVAFSRLSIARHLLDASQSEQRRGVRVLRMGGGLQGDPSGRQISLMDFDFGQRQSNAHAGRVHSQDAAEDLRCPGQVT